MHGIGIIAEYNPFHNGHAYQIQEAKRLSRAYAIVAVMSASFVQRGEPACADKFTRAKWALHGGADLIIELPDVLSCACAQRFAEGGVKLLAATGLVEGICFGSESGNIERLKKTASVELSDEKLKAALSAGYSYPAALAQSFAASGADAAVFNKDAYFSAPNDILGVEYLRAVSRFAPGFKAFAVKREGALHNDVNIDFSSFGPSFASASAIRTAFNKYGAADALPKLKSHIPSFVYDDISHLSGVCEFPTSLSALSEITLYVLRTMSIENIRALADISEGLENVFKRASFKANNVSELLGMVKTKRYTLSRLRRICMNALLGTTNELQHTAANASDALYLRVLGVRREKLYLLSELERAAMLPVVTGYSDLPKLPANALRVSEHTRRASAVRALACDKAKSMKDDFAHPLVIV